MNENTAAVAERLGHGIVRYGATLMIPSSAPCDTLRKVEAIAWPVRFVRGLDGCWWAMPVDKVPRT